MRICFDVDGVIAKGGHPYTNCTPYPHAVETLKLLKQQGHIIILHTDRYMRACHGDVKKATKKGKRELEKWLADNQIPYDELYMGKPHCDLLLDDKASRLNSEAGESPWKMLQRAVDPTRRTKEI